MASRSLSPRAARSRIVLAHSFGSRPSGPVFTTAVARSLRQAGEAAAPVVIDIAKTTAKVAVAAAAVAVPIALGILSIGLTVLASDPVLAIIVPVGDGGDPMWIEIARWYEE